MSAAIVAAADFVYATESSWIFTPFTDLGLLPEGAASYLFVQRMGIAKANEALLQSKKISAQELRACGFINHIFPSDDDTSFRSTVLSYVKEQFDGINRDSLIQSKKLIRSFYSAHVERANIVEAMAGLDRFVDGIPQREFEKLARKSKRHQGLERGSKGLERGSKL